MTRARVLGIVGLIGLCCGVPAILHHLMVSTPPHERMGFLLEGAYGTAVLTVLARSAIQFRRGSGFGTPVVTVDRSPTVGQPLQLNISVPTRFNGTAHVNARLKCEAKDTRLFNLSEEKPTTVLVEQAFLLANLVPFGGPTAGKRLATPGLPQAPVNLDCLRPHDWVTATEKRCIATLDVGGRSLHPATRGALEAAARRCDADLVIFTEPLAKCHIWWQKTFAIDRLLQYDHVLPIDADGLIADDCPSPFPECEPRWLGDQSVLSVLCVNLQFHRLRQPSQRLDMLTMTGPVGGTTSEPACADARP